MTAKAENKPKKASKGATAAKSGAATHAAGRVFVGSIGQIGWPEENVTMSLIAIDEATRKAIGVNDNSIVKVKKVGGSDVKLAMVCRQFKALVGTNSASVNTALKTALGLTESDKVEITAEGILESEADNFRRTAIVGIRDMLRAHLVSTRNAHGCDQPSDGDISWDENEGRA